MRPRPNLTFIESLFLDLWEAVEEHADDDTREAIADAAGWGAVNGTAAGLRERSEDPPLCGLCGEISPQATCPSCDALRTIAQETAE